MDFYLVVCSRSDQLKSKIQSKVKYSKDPDINHVYLIYSPRFQFLEKTLEATIRIISMKWDKDFDDKSSKKFKKASNTIIKAVC